LPTKPNHHPPEEALLGYASGALDEPASVLIATHLALCPECRAKLASFETVGGSIIETLEPATLKEDALADVMALIDAPDSEASPIRVGETTPKAESETGPHARDDETSRVVPQPLRSYLGGDIGALPWKTRGRGVKECQIVIGDGSVRASLLRIRPGEKMPQHTHEGVESTIVLQGAFSDETGRYARGDLAIATADDDHAPVADVHEECICFALIDGPLRLTGPVGRVLNLFIRP